MICSIYQWARFFENQARRLKQQAIFFVIFIRVKLLCTPVKVLENFCNAQGHLSIRKFALNQQAWWYDDFSSSHGSVSIGQDDFCHKESAFCIWAVGKMFWSSNKWLKAAGKVLWSFQQQYERCFEKLCSGKGDLFEQQEKCLVHFCSRWKDILNI